MPEPASDYRLAPADPSVPQSAVAKAIESQQTSVATAKSQSGTPPALRLVIRIRMVPEGPHRTPIRRHLSRGALLLMLGIVAILLSWVGVSVYRSDRTAPAATEGAPNSKSQSPAPAPSEAAPVVSKPLPKPATETAETGSAETKSVESEVGRQPVALTSSRNEVIPEVPQSARETIRGTVRVSVRVILGKEGTVLGATADDPGPSRYFERLAIEAARQWTFTPADSAAQRIMVVRFNFTRAGTTARANTLQ